MNIKKNVTCGFISFIFLTVLTQPVFSSCGPAVLGGNDVISRPNVDTGTSVIYFDRNSPITFSGEINSWSIFTSTTHSGAGQVKLKIFRDIGATWQFIGESPLETVTVWGGVQTFTLPSPISVKAGDIISWWYPHGTSPSIVFSLSGHTIDNNDWPNNPNVDFTIDIPDLEQNPNWGGHGWDNNPRTYSIQVQGIPLPIQGDLSNDCTVDMPDLKLFTPQWLQRTIQAAMWVSGSNTISQNGIYGTKGVAASDNVPGARQYSVSWRASTANLWLFGGSGYDANGNNDLLNDLWKFDGANWTWVSGSNAVDQYGIYGTKGVAAPGNMPGSRDMSVSWKDGQGNLWLFGGYGLASTSSFNLLNDLWKFDGTNWTWVSGSDNITQHGVYGTKGVAASGNVPGARYGSVSWIDGSGNLWLFGGWGYALSGSWGELNDLWKFDGTNWTWVSGSNARNQSGTYGTKGVAASDSQLFAPFFINTCALKSSSP